MVFDDLGTSRPRPFKHERRYIGVMNLLKDKPSLAHILNNITPSKNFSSPKNH